MADAFRVPDGNPRVLHSIEANSPARLALDVLSSLPPSIKALNGVR